MQSRGRPTSFRLPQQNVAAPSAPQGHAAEDTAQARQMPLSDPLQNCLSSDILTAFGKAQHKICILQQISPVYPRGQKAGTGRHWHACASIVGLDLGGPARTCSSSPTRCQNPVCLGTQAFLNVRIAMRASRAPVLAEGTLVRQPAPNTEDRRCACKATCRRSAHGRCAGTWAALSPSPRWQSPPGKSSSW